MDRSRQGDGAGAGGNGADKNKHTYANLPDDAKVACDGFIADGLFKTREEYCERYDW